MCGQWGKSTLWAQPAHMARAKASRARAQPNLCLSPPRGGFLWWCGWGVLRVSVTASTQRNLDLFQGKRSPVLNLPSTWHTSFWTQMDSSAHMAFDKKIYLISFSIHMYLYMYFYAHISHIHVTHATTRKEALKDTQLFAPVGENTIQPTMPIYHWNGNFLTHQAARETDPEGQCLLTNT